MTEQPQAAQASTYTDTRSQTNTDTRGRQEELRCLLGKQLVHSVFACANGGEEEETSSDTDVDAKVFPRMDNVPKAEL